MRINTKCSIALHCILFIAIYENNLKITSEVLAKSTGCNAVIIRNILSLLQKAGIISITRGMGGAHLLKEACDLTLWDIYRSLEPNGLGHLMGVHPEPSPDCPVGKNIETILRKSYAEIENSVKTAMNNITLQHLLDQYNTFQY